MTTLTRTRTDTAAGTTWAVHDTTRATSLTIARGTPDQITRMIEAAPSAAGYCDQDSATVLAHVSTHEQVDGTVYGAEPCEYVGRCDRDTYTSTIARPLFHAAAAARFDDGAVYALLADLHRRAGA